MKTEIFETKLELGRAAADRAAEIIERAISERGISYLIAATGASQFEFLEVLVDKPIDWSKVVFFHLDEYVGLPANHAASFRRYLKERIINRVRPKAFHLIHGEAADPKAECRRVGQLISEQTIDAAFVGIGENGHLAFNDPPADFVTEEPYIVVDLDEACRRQQVGEGWFKTMEQVPRQAISMSIQQIMKAQEVLCIVPDQRKAEAVKSTLEYEVSPLRPASILQRHPSSYLYLDRESASLLSRTI
jgi:glucosamine-6-phosphate deaminase